MCLPRITVGSVIEMAGNDKYRGCLAWTDGEIVRRWIDGGKTDEQISILAQLNCCTRDRIRHVLTAAGYDVGLVIQLPPPMKKRGAKRHKWTEDERRRMIDMRARGWTWKQVAAALGMSANTCSCYAYEYGLAADIDKRRNDYISGKADI